MHGATTAHCVYEGRRASLVIKHLERKSIAIADGLVAVSSHIGALTVKSVGLPKKLFAVIYNGVDTDVFRPSETLADPDEVLYVGTITRRKGLRELMRAIPRVLAARPTTRFRIVGPINKDESGQPLDRHLMDEVPSRYRPAVLFHGKIAHRDLPKTYNSAAVCVFPSLAEAFGLTCIEAMACARPVVMTSLASGPEVVENGVSGLLADPRDTQKLADCILRILANRDVQRAYGKAARLRVESRFSLRSLATDTLQEYGRLIGLSN